jgi:hypothetical protein
MHYRIVYQAQALHTSRCTPTFHCIVTGYGSCNRRRQRRRWRSISGGGGGGCGLFCSGSGLLSDTLLRCLAGGCRRCFSPLLSCLQQANSCRCTRASLTASEPSANAIPTARCRPKLSCHDVCADMPRATCQMLAENPLAALQEAGCCAVAKERPPCCTPTAASEGTPTKSSRMAASAAACVRGAAAGLLLTLAPLAAVDAPEFAAARRPSSIASRILQIRRWTGGFGVSCIPCRQQNGAHRLK